MATFTKQQWTDVDIDVEVEEFVDELHSWEVKELVNYLRRLGYLNDIASHEMNIQDIEWLKVTDKLSNSRLQLSVEEEEIIKNIASRL
jgi:hypothetical protein